MPPLYVAGEELIPESKKRKAEAPLLREVRHETTPSNGQQTTKPKNTIANRYAAAQKQLPTSGAQRSGEDGKSFMVEQSLSSLLEILSSSSVGMDALTSQVAIFGVLQNAHACATTGDELGFEYVRMFIARLARQTSDQVKIARVTEVLHRKLQDQVLRAFSQVKLLGEVLPSTARHSDGNIASNERLRAPAQQLAAKKLMPTPKVAATQPNDLRAIQPAPGKTTQTPVTSVFKAAAKASGIVSSEPQQSKPIQREGSVKSKSMAQNDRVVGSHVSPRETVEASNISYGRPHHHIYPCTSSDGRDEKNAAISADIRNYTEPGEDLDWTKLTDPSERKRLQGIIGGRKYRERQLAAQGKGGSGGNYPGASGEGSSLSAGYGPQRPYGYSKWKSPRPPPTNATPVNSRGHSSSAPGSLLHKALGIQPGLSAPPVVGRNRDSLSTTDSGREPVVYHGLDDQHGDWNHSRSANTLGRVEHAANTGASEPVVIISDDGQEAQGQSGDQGGYEDFFRSLVESVTPKESRIKHERNSAGYTDDGQQQSSIPHSPASMFKYESEDDYQEPENKRPTWEPNAGDPACFQLDNPMKTAFNMFARSAHDAHRFPAKTRKNVVETYHLYIRQVWNLLLEHDKTAWRSLAAARGCFNATELSVKGQHILGSQGFLSKFLPHVEPSFEGSSSVPAASTWEIRDMCRTHGVRSVPVQKCSSLHLDYMYTYSSNFPLSSTC